MYAASVKLSKDCPKTIDDFRKELCFPHPDCGLIKLVQNSLKNIADNCEALKLHEDAVQFISSRVQTIGDTDGRLCKPKPTGLNVLNLGNVWTSNILFKRSETVVHVRFVDYQMTRYASPALDLLHFIWTSADEDVRENKITELFLIGLSLMIKSYMI